MVSLTVVLLFFVLVLLLAGVVALVRGKRRLGAVLLTLGLLPVVLVLGVAGIWQARGTYFGPATVPLSELYKTPVPVSVRVVNFRGETIGMDPSFWWECAPLDEDYLAALKKNAGLTYAKDTGSSLSTGGPHWWNSPQITALPELYMNDKGEGGIRGVWVDRKNNRLFLCFLGY